MRPTTVYLKAIRAGDSFTFTPKGPVYVRCRGGYRPGCGGELVKPMPGQSVYRYGEFRA